jgi:hypothetical protein
MRNPRVYCGVILVALVVVCGGVARFWYGVPANAAGRNVSGELLAIYEADQADRQEFLRLGPEELRKVSERDKQRRQRVAEIVGMGQLNSAEDYFHAAMVLQHGEKSEDYLLAHELATVAGFKGHKTGRWLSAAALDRFLHSVGRPQRFGTQYKRDGDRPWTQEPYDRSLHDSVRREYEVPPRGEQAKRLEELNQGQP